MKHFLSLLFIAFMILPQISALEAVQDLVASSAILYDFTTGRVLYEKEADLTIPPASMTKLVTLYLGWQNIENGNFERGDKVEITSEGSTFSRPPGSSLMLLEEGQNVTYLEILKGLAISSGNDAAYALSHLISGSDKLFVQEMNQLVRSLGYDVMHFVDPDGWSAENQVTAREYAAFSADYIRAFPYALQEIHSQEYFIYPKEENLPDHEARIITARRKKNTNILLGQVPGVDGLKTGYIDESGFNFTATAKRDNSRYIAVIMGIKDVPYSEGIKIRAQEAADLLEYGFSNYKTIYPEKPDFKDVIVWEGELNTLSVQIEEEPVFTLSIDEMTSFTSTVSLDEEMTAPIEKGESVGSILYRTSAGVLNEFPILAAQSINKANIFKVLWHKIVRQYRSLTNP